MRYFRYTEPDENDQEATFVVSEDEIEKTYYPVWRRRMIEKYGEQVFNDCYTFYDCVDDWVTIHWAEEVTDA